MNDTISRQAAIRWVKTECNPYGKPTLDFESGKKVIEHLEQMPSAERTGHWVDTYNDGDWHCSECGAIVEKDEQTRHYWQRCYHCGAKMDGGGDNG